MSPVWHSWDSSSSRWSPLEKRDPIPLRPLVNLASPVGAETVLHRMDPGVHGILRALTLQEIKPVLPSLCSYFFYDQADVLVPRSYRTHLVSADNYGWVPPLPSQPLCPSLLLFELEILAPLPSFDAPEAHLRLVEYERRAIPGPSRCGTSPRYLNVQCQGLTRSFWYSNPPLRYQGRG